MGEEYYLLLTLRSVPNMIAATQKMAIFKGIDFPSWVDDTNNGKSPRGRGVDEPLVPFTYDTVQRGSGQGSRDLDMSFFL